MSRDPWTVLVEASPRTPIDEAGLARARGQVDAWRRSSATPAGSRRHQARPARRVLAVAGLSVAAAVVAVILPLGNPASTDSPTSILGVLPAAAVGLGCTNESDPVPGLSDPDQVVPRQQWATLSPVRQIMFLVGDGTPELASATSGPAVCDAIPVAVLTDEAGQGGIVVYRDVTEPFRGATHLAEVTVRGYPAKVLSPAARHHYASWTDADGVRWFVEAAGLTVDELVATLDLSLDDAGLARVPEGYQAAAIPEHDPTGTDYRWSVQYETGGYIYLEVTSPARVPVEARAAWGDDDQQYTTVNGERALYLPYEQGGAGIRWATEDASYRLVVAGADLTQLREMAEHVELVTADDPRLPTP